MALEIITHKTFYKRHLAKHGQGEKYPFYTCEHENVDTRKRYSIFSLNLKVLIL